MQLGRFTIEQLSEGQFELFPDGKINRTPVSDSDRHPLPGLPGSESLAGINPVYVTDSVHHVLIDTGLGWGLDAGSSYTDVSNVITNLDVFDVAPDDITHVILSHLHYDHAAGVSFTDESAATRPVFPNAKYIVQKPEWDFAVRQVQDQRSGQEFYNLDDLYRLYSDGFFHFITSDMEEVIPGISLIRTGGHTPGHQIVTISDDDSTAYYFGDLIPTEHRLNQAEPTGRDENHVRAKKWKTNILRQAYSENAYLLFYHSIHSKIGRLEKDEDLNYVLKEI